MRGSSQDSRQDSGHEDFREEGLRLLKEKDDFLKVNYKKEDTKKEEKEKDKERIGGQSIKHILKTVIFLMRKRFNR